MQRVYEENEWGKVSKRIITLLLIEQVVLHITQGHCMEDLLPTHRHAFISAWESSLAHPQISTSFLFVSGTSQH